jgi:hypothetical protein
MSHVMHHAGTLDRLMVQQTRSNYYRKKWQPYLRPAHSLVKQEEQELAEQPWFDFRL